MVPNWVHPEQQPQCIYTALFLHDFPAGIFLPLMPPLAIGLTFAIRYLALGSITKPSEGSNPEDIENSAIPSPTDGSLEGQTDQPPPYQPPEPEAPVSTPPEKPAKKRSPAGSFVLATPLFIVLLAAHFIWALSIQWLTFCMGDIPIPLAIIFWAMFSLVGIWSSVGVGCWLILLRNLWGPAAKKRYPINEEVVPQTLYAAAKWVATGPLLLVGKGILTVVAMPFTLIGSGAVKAVETCQRCCCPGALEEEEMEGEELEEGRALFSAHGNEWEGDSNEGNESGLTPK